MNCKNEKKKILQDIQMIIPILQKIVISILSLILAIWGIVDAVTHCKQEDKVVGVILALFIWPLYWILRLSGAFCKK